MQSAWVPGAHLEFVRHFIFIYLQIVAGMLMWGALSDERTDLELTDVAGPCQQSLSRIRAPRNSWLCFYYLKFETPPTSSSRFPYLFPSGTGQSSYTPRHGVCIKMSKSKLSYDRRSVGQSLLVPGNHLSLPLIFP
jgi:hypothetical protein